MNCIIVEDQLPAQRILIRYIKDLGTLTLQDTFTDALQALQFLKTNATDLIFLDIHLPKISGIDFIKTLTNPPQIILTTAFSDYALDGYELNIVDYLLKPFSFDRFVKAVSKLTQTEISDRSKPYDTSLFIKSGHEYVKIKVDQILYITSDLDYTEIHTIEKVHVSAERLNYWQQKLPKQFFMRVHKSHLVNVAKVNKVFGNLIQMENRDNIPIGRAYKEEFMTRITS